MRRPVSLYHAPDDRPSGDDDAPTGEFAARPIAPQRDKPLKPRDNRPGVFDWFALRWAWGLLLTAWAVFVAWLVFAPPTWWSGESPGLRPAGHAVPMLRVWLALFADRPWHWMVNAQRWIDLGVGLVGLAAMTLAGRLFFGHFRVHMPRLVEVSLWVALGIGVTGTVFTVVALAGFLFQWFSLLVFVAMLGLLWLSQRLVQARLARSLPHESEEGPRVRPRQTLRDQVRLARRREAFSWLPPTSALESGLVSTMRGAIGVIVLLTFYHAVFFAETYWDSLILYLGYARDIYLEGRFPVKVVGQVGVGLGANYPHLFEITGAVIAAWAGTWSSLYLQLAAPLAGLATILLTYHMALRVSRSVTVAVLATLIIRVAPYLTTYHTYASNYSFAILFATAFLYCALRYVEDGLPGYLALAAWCAGFGMQVNYLMLLLWPLLILTVVVAHWPRRPERRGIAAIGEAPDGAAVRPDLPPDFASLRARPSLREAIADHGNLAMIAVPLAAGSIWYLRNLVVTGNPVYAFFTGLFPWTRHVNPEVMASADLEWQAHGDGIGIAGPTLGDRIAYTWEFFATNFTTCYKWAPVFLGLVVPGVLVFLSLWARESMVRRSLPPDMAMPGSRDTKIRAWSDRTRAGVVAFALLGGLFAYHYLLGPFYLYHLLPAFAVFGFFVALALNPVPRPLLLALCVWGLLAALLLGVPWALIGSKFTGASEISGRVYRGMELEALRHPGIDDFTFRRWTFGREPLVWQRLNREAAAEASGRDLAPDERVFAVLTHENRRLVFNPAIALVHMDDWEVQEVWNASEDEKLERLRELGVRYYLEIPYEFDHPINARLGHRDWIGTGVLVKEFEAGDDVLYRFVSFEKQGGA